MPDDPSKRYKDRDTVSWQDWEIEHVVDKLCKDFPKKPRPAIENVINACKETSLLQDARDSSIALEEAYLRAELPLFGIRSSSYDYAIYI